jgi:SAM-dependent methyltransferase
MDFKKITEQVRSQYERYPYPDIDPETEKPNMLVPCHLGLMCNLLWGGKKKPEGLRVLDAGCGTGSPLVAMALSFPEARIVGIDFSETSLKKARQLADRHQLKNIQFHQLPIEQVGKLEQKFDFILSSGVLHHLKSPTKGLSALGEVLDSQGAISIMLYGKYGRKGINMLQKAIRLSFSGNETTEKDMEERIGFANQVVKDIPGWHPFKTRKLGREIQEGKDAGIVDLLLHARDLPFDVTSVYSMCERSGLQFHRWLFPIIYNPATYIREPSALGKIQKLSQQKQNEVAELVHGKISKHSFFAVRPEFNKPYKDLSNGFWRELKAELTPCLAWNRTHPLPQKEGFFAIPPAVIQDEWEYMTVAQWELVFLSQIQPEIPLGKILENPSVKKLLPSAKKEDIDSAVQNLLEKVLDVMGIVLIN